MNKHTLIIPFVLVSWLMAIAVFRDAVPPEAQIALAIACSAAVVVIVCRLVAGMGWGVLARQFRTTTPFTGKWHRCPTAQISKVGAHHPEFVQNRLMFIGGTINVGTSSDGFYVSTMVARVPLLGSLFPTIFIPWEAVSAANMYEASALVIPPAEVGLLAHAQWKPDVTGTFVELTVGDPPLFIELPATEIKDAIPRLPLVGNSRAQAE